MVALVFYLDGYFNIYAHICKAVFLDGIAGCMHLFC